MGDNSRNFERNIKNTTTVSTIMENKRMKNIMVKMSVYYIQYMLEIYYNFHVRFLLFVYLISFKNTDLSTNSNLPISVLYLTK